MSTEQQVLKWIGRFRSFPAICPRCNTKFMIYQQLLKGTIYLRGKRCCPTCEWDGGFRFPWLFKVKFALKLKTISVITRLIGGD